MEYLYTGAYTPSEPSIQLDHAQIAQQSDASHTQGDPKHIPLVGDPIPAVVTTAEDESEQPLEEPIPDAFEWDLRRPSYKKKSKSRKAHSSFAVYTADDVETVRSRREILWDEFVEPVETHGQDSKPRQKKEAHEDHRHVILCHARLYVFADKYDIQPLEELTLLKLRQTLALLTFFEERKEEIVQLLQYCYANTPERTETKDRLRALVIHYVACVVERLKGSEKFRLLLGEANSISFDLVNELEKRLD